MRVGILLPGFSSDETDWAIPVQLNLVRVLAQEEDVRVLALRYPHRCDHYQVYGAQVYALGAGQTRGAGRIRLWLNALRTLQTLHRQKPFDVLHAMWADETGLVAAWAGRWLGIPVVVSVAGGELVGFDDLVYGLQRSRFSRWIVGQALKGADRIIVACSYVEKLITTAGYSIPSERIRTAVLGVDPVHFQPPPAPSSEFPLRLIHVASLVGVKDQATLLGAVARIPHPVTLDLVGSGPEVSRLRQLVSTLNLTSQVCFRGSVTHPDLPALYQQAALNILTSRHEGLGMVTLEAAACGVPTVSTAVGLLPDHPSLGVSVPVGDASALAAAITHLLDDPVLRHEYARTARQTVLNQFTIAHTVRDFRAIYAELISDSG